MQLSTFQDGFATALHTPPGADAPPWLAALVAQPGFAVYRNTVLKGCLDALQAHYPTVCRLVGEDWFRAAARVFAQDHPPLDGQLVDYGAGFADFLQGFAPAADLPYLPGVARLDRAWTEAHLAADAPVLDAGWLAQQPPEALAGLCLAPHPAARWLGSDAHPCYTLWQRHRDGLPVDGAIPWHGEGALLSRPAAAVQWTRLSPAGLAFLQACAQGQPLDAAAAAALAAEAQADLSALMAQLLHAGALRALPAPPLSFHPAPEAP
ncbi:MAG: DNA-binding domain-containing protein [Burkholderiaceae bacterium]|nr:DNA-binding domain-containing protein [Burkholderiaceae bacterium]